MRERCMAHSRWGEECINFKRFGDYCANHLVEYVKEIPTKLKEVFDEWEIDKDVQKEALIKIFGERK